jgi:hypothetical protein
MKNFLLLLFLVGFFQTSTAQYTELINSRRPGFSDSPFSVGTDVLQFEGGLFYENVKDQGNKVSSIGTELMVRYGKFFEKLEINLNVSFQYDNVNFKDPLMDDLTNFGLSQLTIGGKYLVYMPTYMDRSKEIRSWKAKTKFDWKRLVPSVAIYAGANIPVTKNFIRGNFPGYVNDTFSPRIAVYTQNNFTDQFVFLMNLIMDKIGSGTKENSYILTGTYTLNNKLSFFAEHQGIFKDKDIPNDFQFGAGAAYLFDKNKQVDLSIRAISDRDGSTFLVGAGFAWRFDKHNDKFKLIGSDGDVNSDDDEKKGGFFSRIFGKKEKSPEKRKVKKVKAKKRKIVKDKAPKKTKAQKKREKEALKKLKEEQKAAKKKAKSYDKNYEPPSN